MQSIDFRALQSSTFLSDWPRIHPRQDTLKAFFLLGGFTNANHCYCQREFIPLQAVFGKFVCISSFFVSFCKFFHTNISSCIYILVIVSSESECSIQLHAYVLCEFLFWCFLVVNDGEEERLKVPSF